MKYQGHTIEVTREECDNSPYKYDFFLYIDGEEVTTATKQEKDGVSFEDVVNWTTYLKHYGRNYVDGMNH